MTPTNGKVVWEKAPTKLVRKSCFVEVYGDTGTGRTSWALSAPGPIALLHAAEKLEGVVQRYSVDKDIRMFNFGGVFKGTNDEVSKQSMVLWKKLEDAWYDAFTWARTIVLDTHTEAWELIRLAYFGDLKPSGGRVDANYGPVNARWRSLFKHFKTQDRTNIVVIGQTKDEYKTEGKSNNGMGQRTGRTIVAGQKEVGFLADVRIRTSFDMSSGTFQSEVQKPWWNGVCIGLELQDDMSTFPQAMSMITETDEEKWR